MQWKDLFQIRRRCHLEIAVFLAVPDVSAQAGCGCCAREAPVMSDMCLYYLFLLREQGKKASEIWCHVGPAAC